MLKWVALIRYERGSIPQRSTVRFSPDGSSNGVHTTTLLQPGKPSRLYLTSKRAVNCRGGETVDAQPNRV